MPIELWRAYPNTRAGFDVVVVPPSLLLQRLFRS
jgi:hypothetical protein